MKLRKSPEQRALFAAAREARREAAPSVNWDALEERLLRKTRVSGAEATSRRASSWFFLLVPVTAVVAGFAFFSVRKAPPHPSASVSNVAAPLDGDALQRTDVLITRDQPLRVVHDGRAEWTLSPNARAVVLEHAKVVQIRLEAGTLTASVLPSAEAERFVVLAAGLRVAVHGTRFRVELRDDRAVVQVEEGVVAVQPRVPVDAKAVLLRAPSHEEFTLAGSFMKSGAHPTTASGSKASPRPAQHAARAAASPPSPAPETRATLTIGEVEAGVTSVVEAVSGCFRDHTEKSPHMKISVRTSVTLEVGREGTVNAVRFEPGLSPAVQACSEENVQAVRFAASSDGARVTRVLELER